MQRLPFPIFKFALLCRNISDYFSIFGVSADSTITLFLQPISGNIGRVNPTERPTRLPTSFTTGDPNSFINNEIIACGALARAFPALTDPALNGKQVEPLSNTSSYGGNLKTIFFNLFFQNEHQVVHLANGSGASFQKSSGRASGGLTTLIMGPLGTRSNIGVCL